MIEEFDFKLIDPGDSEQAYYFVFRDNNLLWSGSSGFPRPATRDEWHHGDLAGFPTYYFGSYGGLPCYAVQCDDPDAGLPDHEWIGMRRMLMELDEALFAIAGRGRQILEFNRTHKYCGRCGGPTRQHEKESALYCAACEHFYYPRISPCIIVLVTRGEELLLARSSRFPNGMYSTLAGFVEPGETIEQAVHREVQEEVGVEIGGLRYYASQSWPFPHQLMIGFHAEHKAGDIKIDDEEIVDARWWHYTDLPLTPTAAALSGKLIESYLEQLKIST